MLPRLKVEVATAPGSLKAIGFVGRYRVFVHVPETLASQNVRYGTSPTLQRRCRRVRSGPRGASRATPALAQSKELFELSTKVTQQTFEILNAATTRRH